MVALIHSGVGQAFAIGEQVSIESVLGKTILLGGTAGVVNKAVGEGTCLILLVENHFLGGFALGKI